MSGGEAAEETVEKVQEVGEPRQMSDRTAKAVLTVVALGAMWGIVVAFPWIAYVLVGVLATLGWQKAHGRFTKTAAEEPNEGEPDEQPEEQPLLTAEDIVRALHQLAAPHVFLSSLAAELDLTTEETRAVLEELHVPIRRAVRVGSTTGVGVHKDDLPPLPQDPETDPVDGVDQGQPTNQRALTVEEIGLAGKVIRDSRDVVRHHRVK